MPGTSRCLALTCALVACAGASSRTPAPTMNLTDGAYELVIDQRYRSGCGSPKLPDDAIPDHCFDAVTPPVSYPVELSENGTRVEIVGVIEEGAAVRGSVEAGPADRVYALDLFAGGRLRIRGTAAELTVFGSGVPIVKSERGHLKAR